MSARTATTCLRNMKMIKGAERRRERERCRRKREVVLLRLRDAYQNKKERKRG